MASNPANNLLSLLEETREDIPLGTGSFSVRPLTLTEIVTLLLENQDAFFTMYSAAMKANEGKSEEGAQMDLAPVLAAAPVMVSRVIAAASDQDVETAAPTIEKKMAGTVQLIALDAIWRLSVPDPKKLASLLSGVMGRLRRGTPVDGPELVKTSLPTS